MIQFENVSRRYGNKVAVAGLDLEIRRGELFALLGPNGAGKTTTIKMVVGLLRPASGVVRVCGHDVVTECRQSNQLLGYIPDVPYLYDKLTGREFLQFIADMYGLDAAAASVRMGQQIEQFALHDFVNDLTESYSHGMKQRLAFAAAMLHDPAVLVIDEPMIGLDPLSIRLLKDLLREKAAAGMTILMSTHLLGVAEEIADRVGIVDRGRLRFLGTLDELRQNLGAGAVSLERLYLDFVSSFAVAGSADGAAVALPIGAGSPSGSRLESPLAPRRTSSPTIDGNGKPLGGH